MHETEVEFLDVGPVSERALAGIRSSAERMVNRMEEWNVGPLACLASRVRKCIWKGQEWDERVGGEDAFPFDGASDLRIRLAEYLTNSRVSEAMAALMRAQVSFGATGGDTRAARFLGRLWRNVLERDLGAEWFSQMSLLALYLYGGGRGCAGLWVDWERVRELRPRWVSAAEVQGMFLESGRSEEEWAAAVESEESLAGVCEFLGFARAKKMARELVRDGRARVWEEQVVRDKPMVRALALGQELWIDPTTRVMGGDDAQQMHLVEWMSRVEIMAAAKEEGWSKAFVDRLLSMEGGTMEAVFPEWDYMDEDRTRVSRVESSREAGKYQIVRSFVRAMTKDGVPGRFVVVWSPGCPVAAKDAELVDTPYGGWPVLVFSTSIAGTGAMDGVGEPIKAAGLQQNLKLSADMVSDLSMLQLPPLVTSGVADAGGGSFAIEPLGQINLGAMQDAKWLTPPQVSQGTLQWMKATWGMVDRFFGLAPDGRATQETETAAAMRVVTWLQQCGEAVRRVLSMCVANMDPAQFEGMPDFSSGKFPVRLKCDPRAWNLEYMERVGRVMKDLLMPMDRKGRLDTEAAVEALVLDLVPEHAELLNDSAEATEEQVAGVEHDLMLIRNGIRPQVPEGGAYDYAGRLQYIEQMQAVNPNVFADMGQDKQQLLKEFVEGLRFQVQQMQNAQVGRQGYVEGVGAMEGV